MSISELNLCDRERFVEAIGWVFEDSPWVAERAWTQRPFSGVEDLHSTMVAQVDAARPDEQLALLRAHPDLGSRARIRPASTNEQAGAGLNQLTPEEFDLLSRLNSAYRDKFGFPFLLAVKGSTKDDILRALGRRLQSGPAEEFREALLQVYRIAGFRLHDVFREEGRTVKTFASGWKRNYYGKGDVIVYRLNRDGKCPEGQCPVFGANVSMLVYGDAFWPTYTTGDNTGLIATDSMKNFIQRETLNFVGADLEDYCRFIGVKFLEIYPQVEGVQVSAAEIPYANIRKGEVAFAPSGPERATARIELGASGIIETASGIRGFRLLRLGGSTFHGFVRDQYTTLPDIANRPLHMWLDLEWLYTELPAAFSQGGISAAVRGMIYEVFETFDSGSIQELIHRIGTRMLAEIPAIAEVHLEARNRSWDTVVEQGESIGVYTDAAPPYGCLGLRLRR